MLIEKHEKDNTLTRIPGLTLRLSPELAPIDRVLEDEELFCRIRADLASSGIRPGKPAPTRECIPPPMKPWQKP